MFRYYFRLGIRSLRRNMVLTGLMVAAIAVGIEGQIDGSGSVA